MMRGTERRAERLRHATSTACTACSVRASSRCADRRARRTRRTRRGFVLPLVLLVGLGLLLVAAASASLAGAERQGLDAVRGQVRSRLAARSALAAVLAELAGRREALLDGEGIELPDELELWEEEDGRVAVVRFLPLNAAGDLVASESARLDLNTVTAERLVATGEVDETLARGITAARARRGGRFASVDDLLEVPGVTAARLYGDEAFLNGDGFDPATTEGIAGEIPLAELLTVHAWEPELQRDGTLRIPIGIGWSEELGGRLDEKFGEGTGDFVRAMMDEGTDLSGRGRIVDLLVEGGVPAADWAETLDALSYTDGVFAFGRLDLNRASEAAIASLPGIDGPTAAAIANARDGLDAEARATWWWPVTLELVEPAAFAAWADLVTNRGWTWRLRLEVGFVDEGAEPVATRASGGPVELGSTVERARGGTLAPLVDPIRLEVVVDCSEPRPRLAMVRDVTLLAAVARMTDLAAAEDPDDRAGAFDGGPDGDAFAADGGFDPFDPFARFDPGGEEDDPDGFAAASGGAADGASGMGDDPFAGPGPMESEGAGRPRSSGPPASGAPAGAGAASAAGRRAARWGG